MLSTAALDPLIVAEVFGAAGESMAHTTDITLVPINKRTGGIG
jgi:hypothetical protein